MMPRSEEAHKRTRTARRTAPKLVVLTGPDTGTELVLDRPTLTVGRSPACDLVLGSRRISGRHARIEVNGQQVVLADGGSTNGTWIEGERLNEPVVLADGDVVSFAEVAVLFEAGRRTSEEHRNGRSAREATRPVPATKLPDADTFPAAEITLAGSAAVSHTVPESPTVPESATLPESPAVAESPAEPVVPAAPTASRALALPEPEPVPAGPESLPVPFEALPALPDSLVTEIAPNARKRTVLISHAPADAAVAELLFDLLQRTGHLVWMDQSADGEGWHGRLLDTMWSCDVVLFLVSPAVVECRGVKREVHLAGSERTPVVPVLLADTDLPPDLAFYLAARQPIDLRTDPDAALRRLLDEVESVHRKRIARPWRLFTMMLSAVLLLGVVAAALRYVLG